MATETQNISTEDTIKILLFLAAVIAVLSLIYFTFVKPVTSLVKAAPSGAIPFALGGLAGGLFASKFLKGSAVNPTADANAAAASQEEIAAGEQASTTEAAGESAAAEDAGAATAEEAVGAGMTEEVGGAALTEEMIPFLFL